MRKTIVTIAAVTLCPIIAAAQAPNAQRAALLAIADSALAAISRGDMPGLAEMMTPEARTMSVRAGDSVRYSIRTRDQYLTPSPQRKITERGFTGEVRVSGPLATVWLPYDLYIEGAWSHCGVDVFTLVQLNGKWKIASIAWTIEQPPACQKHPDGPPRQM
ncbi:MAG TPA: hypothetical protein VJR92_13290 [Gemmatimonadaceae bacterium]|nr:hypothetical protein [Gemmatimonadaceae bacterium]